MKTKTTSSNNNLPIVAIATTKEIAEQKKYLLQRLGNATEARSRRYNAPEPQRIKDARKVIDNYEDERDDAFRRYEKECKRKYDLAKEYIYMHSPEKALDAVKQYEEFVDNAEIK